MGESISHSELCVAAAGDAGELFAARSLAAMARTYLQGARLYSTHLGTIAKTSECRLQVRGLGKVGVHVWGQWS